MAGGAVNARRLIAIVDDTDSDLPVDTVVTLKVWVAALTHIEVEIGKRDAEIAVRERENDVAAGRISRSLSWPGFPISLPQKCASPQGCMATTQGGSQLKRAAA